ncbi:MAG: TraR/DksA family transcriptional regulator [Solirubrobacteraceae bacterium]
MEAERARELLARERERVERAMGIYEGEPLESDARHEPGDVDSEDLYQDEFDAGRTADLRDQLSAVQRAEARMRDGTYGLSVQSGDPIPDARLEARPTAELTVDEQQRAGR